MENWNFQILKQVQKLSSDDQISHPWNTEIIAFQLVHKITKMQLFYL